MTFEQVEIIDDPLRTPFLERMLSMFPSLKILLPENESTTEHARSSLRSATSRSNAQSMLRSTPNVDIGRKDLDAITAALYELDALLDDRQAFEATISETLYDVVRSIAELTGTEPLLDSEATEAYVAKIASDLTPEASTREFGQAIAREAEKVTDWQLVELLMYKTNNTTEKTMQRKLVTGLVLSELWLKANRLDAIVSAYQAGEFDCEILAHQIEQEANSGVVASEVEFAVRVAQAFAEVDRRMVIEAVASGRINLPPKAQELALSYRNDLLNRLGNFIEEGRKKLGNIRSTGRSVEEVIQSLRLHYERHSLRMFSNNTNIPVPRRLKIKTRAAEINDELKAEQAESQDVQEPCPLREVKVASEKLGLEELIENYVNQYRGTRLLYEDLVAAVEWLRKIDFSNGPVRGVKQHHYTIEIDGKMLPVYGLKPQDAVGVPTRSKTARHTRVTFTYTEQTITVVDIHYRGDMAQLERSLGLGAVRRG